MRYSIAFALAPLALVAGCQKSATIAANAPDSLSLAEQADTDNDGSITRSEFNNRAEARFAQLDTDNDGVVISSEFMGASDSDRRTFMNNDRAVNRAFNKIDTDRDGDVTRDEYLSKADAFFDRLDIDHDSMISDEELAKAQRKGTSMLHRKS